MDSSDYFVVQRVHRIPPRPTVPARMWPGAVKPRRFGGLILGLPEHAGGHFARRPTRNSCRVTRPLAIEISTAPS
jgi:hypothetical protein